MHDDSLLSPSMIPFQRFESKEGYYYSHASRASLCSRQTPFAHFTKASLPLVNQLRRANWTTASSAGLGQGIGQSRTETKIGCGLRLRDLDILLGYD